MECYLVELKDLPIDREDVSDVIISLEDIEIIKYANLNDFYNIL